MTEPENLPAVATEEDSGVDADTDKFLRAEKAIAALNAVLPESKHLTPIPTDYKFKKRDASVVGISMHAAFELNGGVNWLMSWARQNPGKFFEMWSKFANVDGQGSGGKTTINILSAIPAVPSDNYELDDNGKAYDPDDADGSLDAEYTVKDDE